MKKIIKITILFILSFSLLGCSKVDNQNNDTLNNQEEIQTINNTDINNLKKTKRIDIKDRDTNLLMHQITEKSTIQNIIEIISKGIVNKNSHDYISGYYRYIEFIDKNNDIIDTMIIFNILNNLYLEKSNPDIRFTIDSNNMKELLDIITE